MTHSDSTGRRELSFRSQMDTEKMGLEIIDPIERHRILLGTSGPVSPKSATGRPFRFPVDAAVTIKTAALNLPSDVLGYVRDAEGEMLTPIEYFTEQTFPAAPYTIELNAPIKLYLRVKSSIAISVDFSGMQLEFSQETEILVGARSRHKHPAATITTTADPVDMMHAVAAFGSALKTTNPERSYPTLRGHPPTVELGDRLDVPDDLISPETGITIEIPPTYASIYTVAPLVYYLGADLASDENPQLRTNTGFTYALDDIGTFEDNVEHVLKQIFFLDCLTRTEGLYPVTLHERQMLEADPKVNLDFAALYGLSPAERLEAYLDVPFSTIENYLPEWKLTTHVEPVSTSIETLPFLVNDFAIIRTSTRESTAKPALGSETIGLPVGVTGDDEFTRSTGSSARVQAVNEIPYVEPEVTDSLEQAWVGDGMPIGASKSTTTAYHNRLARTPNKGDIAITVVCNDTEMDDERELIDEIYGDRAELPFSVTVRHNLTTNELRKVLATPTDFLHYIGHIDEVGFACADGKLDVTTLDSVAVDAFLLNACQSYAQGMALIDAGAIGGIVTLTDVINSEAIRIGQTLARLFNCGFPLRSALKLASDESFIGGQYLVVGDGGLAITQVEGGTPHLYNIESQDKSFDVRIETFPTTEFGMGTSVVPGIERDNRHYLSSGIVEKIGLPPEELDQLIGIENVPLRIDGKLRWSNDVNLDTL